MFWRLDCRKRHGGGRGGEIGYMTREERWGSRMCSVQLLERLEVGLGQL